MSAHPIIFYDRYAGCRKEEVIYGDRALRFAYETRPGRALAWMLFSRPFVSRLFGWYMKRSASAARIRPFIKKYGLLESEFARPVEAYASFNDFFCRELKPEARPVDTDPAVVVFPADGRHSGWEVLGSEQQVYVKGQKWDLLGLLGGDSELAQRFAGGSLVLSRLCPVDYHHFHYPVAGKVLERRLVDGPLFSVSPVALRRRLNYLWENRRIITRIATSAFGEVCFLAVGATNVGSIRHRPLPDNHMVSKGEPAGLFEFGGSSVLTVFEPGRIRLAADLCGNTRDGIELYARVGDRMGSRVS